ncbi:hypothetical protein L915_11672 [Phytophthora nicotianae]|uniref:RxLR effector protein n=1 Tax=Phytophthora nicotianae TaxID=4792 RepID=W2GLC9_PHYNI|nr:hypothetical protein L915_11673 [Phytophthora nicotianae]ETK83034.1 hypothetical protein L915_11672 [Phytophthora nicotianae]ETL36414.1 hypothetical protein L916_11595 [Phytophthora nicotianae]ETL36417.1 hypothetical protein L916_11594 [Phytophthora nicotianae]
MRFYYTLLATAAALLVHSDALPAAAETSLNQLTAVDGTTITSQRFLRRHTDSETTDNEERLNSGPIVLDTAKKIDDLFEVEKLDKILDPKMADKFLDGKTFFGWLDKSALDEALNGNIAQKTKVFEHWREKRLRPKALTKVLTTDPAVRKKYKFVYEMYDSYIKYVARKKLSGLKRNRGD